MLVRRNPYFESIQSTLNMKKVFVILVALKSQRFNHVCMEPQMYYESFEEAYKVQEQLLLKGTFKRRQLRIQTLWRIPILKN